MSHHPVRRRFLGLLTAISVLPSRAFLQDSAKSTSPKTIGFLLKKPVEKGSAQYEAVLNTEKGDFNNFKDYELRTRSTHELMLDGKKVSVVVRYQDLYGGRDYLYKFPKIESVGFSFEEEFPLGTYIRFIDREGYVRSKEDTAIRLDFEFENLLNVAPRNRGGWDTILKQNEIRFQIVYEEQVGYGEDRKYERTIFFDSKIESKILKQPLVHLSAAHEECVEAIQNGKGVEYSSSCWLTSICCFGIGLPDNCWELRTLRNFRDHYVRPLPEGPDLLQEYSDLSRKLPPLFSTQRARIPWTYLSVILPCALLAKLGLHRLCLTRYRHAIAAMRLKLKCLKTPLPALEDC